MDSTAPTPHALRRLLTMLGALLAGLALPLCALAATGHGTGSGGAGLGSTSPTVPESTTRAMVGEVNVTVSVQGDGITLITTASAQTGGRLTFHGTARRDARGSLRVEYRSPGTHRHWVRARTTVVSSRGTFATTWRPTVSGRLEFRAREVKLSAGPDELSGDSQGTGSTRVTPGLSVTVFRTGKATWYGPGLWGRHTACGEKLTPHTFGVANRTLPCGTKVTLYYRGREIVVPVIDRGPYGRHAASWDLTWATSRALRTPGLAKLGSLYR